MKTILVISPHTDDGELGCGGTINRFVNEGKIVYYIAFSICEESVPSGFPANILEIEVKKATASLGIKPENVFIEKLPVRKFPQFRQDILERMVQLDREINPDLVFIPSSFDVHQDHQTIHNEGLRAFKRKSILGYEFMWNNYSFHSTLFSALSERDIQAKIYALDQYKSQAKRLYTQSDLIKGQAQFRGLQISLSYAEAFEVLRWIL